MCGGWQEERNYNLSISVFLGCPFPGPLAGEDGIFLEPFGFRASSSAALECVCVLVAQLCLTLCDLMDQAPLSMKFSRQEYWSGQLFPSPGVLPDTGIEPASPALSVGFFYH